MSVWELSTSEATQRVPLAELVDPSVQGSSKFQFSYAHELPSGELPDEVSQELFGNPTRSLGKLSLAMTQVERFRHTIGRDGSAIQFENLFDTPFRFNVAIGSERYTDKEQRSGILEVAHLAMVHPEAYRMFYDAVRASDYYEPTLPSHSLAVNGQGLLPALRIHQILGDSSWSGYEAAYLVHEKDKLRELQVIGGELRGEGRDALVTPYKREVIQSTDVDYQDYNIEEVAMFRAVIAADPALSRLLEQYPINDTDGLEEFIDAIEEMDTLDDEDPISGATPDAEALRIQLEDIEQRVRDRLFSKVTSRIISAPEVIDWLRDIIPLYRDPIAN